MSKPSCFSRSRSCRAAWRCGFSHPSLPLEVTLAAARRRDRPVRRVLSDIPPVSGAIAAPRRITISSPQHARIVTSSCDVTGGVRRRCHIWPALLSLRPRLCMTGCARRVPSPRRRPRARCPQLPARHGQTLVSTAGRTLLVLFTARAALSRQPRGTAYRNVMAHERQRPLGARRERLFRRRALHRPGVPVTQECISHP